MGGRIRWRPAVRWPRSSVGPDSVVATAASKQTFQDLGGAMVRCIASRRSRWPRGQVSRLAARGADVQYRCRASPFMQDRWWLIGRDDLRPKAPGSNKLAVLRRDR